MQVAPFCMLLCYEAGNIAEKLYLYCKYVK